VSGPDSCSCADLPDAQPGDIQSQPAVAGFVSDELDKHDAAFYQCLDCGQWWRDGYNDDHVLRKVASPPPPTR
jgi:hypothetical protein